VRHIMLLVLVFTMGLSVSSQAQEHAPTVEVFRADLAVWYNHDMAADYFNAEAHHISDNAKNHTLTAKLPLKEIAARTREMVLCEAVDKQYFR
jgi:hypothetical protein